MIWEIPKDIMYCLAYIWRALFLSVMYPLFALACLATLSIFPFACLFFRQTSEREKALRRVAHNIAKVWLRTAWLFNVLNYETINNQTIDRTGTKATLLVSNHPTLIDVIILLAREPEVCCVLKSELNRFALLKILINKLGYISNDDPERLLEAGVARLNRGETLLIFPEGTRTVPGVPVNFRLGAAELAIRTNAEVQTIIIHYQGRHLSKSCAWYEFPSAKLQYKIEIGRSFEFSGKQSINNRKHAQYVRRSLNAELQNYYQARLRQRLSDLHAASQELSTISN